MEPIFKEEKKYFNPYTCFINAGAVNRYIQTSTKKLGSIPNRAVLKAIKVNSSTYL